MEAPEGDPRRRKPVVLCYGDSLTAGYTALTKYSGTFSPWAPLLSDALGVAVDHVGMCGWTAAQMFESLDSASNSDICKMSFPGLRRLLREGTYTHVLLMAGSNDLKRHHASDIVEKVQRLHSVCHTAGVRTLALGIPHSKSSCAGSTSGRADRRRQVNERLRAYAAATGGWCVFCSPGEERLVWEEGSSHFEADGLHLTRAGYARFADLLLRSGLRSFLLHHARFEPILPRALPAAELAWRRGVRDWMQMYKDAVEVVQDAVFDAQMAKASMEELESLHSVLQAEGVPGLRKALQALELQRLHKVLLEGGIPGLRAALKATKRGELAAAKARHRGDVTPTPTDIAKLAQTAFVPTVGAPLQDAARRLRTDPSTLCARLAAWRSSEDDVGSCGDLEDKDAIETFVDGVFTVCTFDNAAYQKLPLPPTHAESGTSRQVPRAGCGGGNGGGDGGDGGTPSIELEVTQVEHAELDIAEPRSDGSSDVDGRSDGDGSSECSEDLADVACKDGFIGAMRVPWLSLPSPMLVEGAFVHRGPLSGGHLKLYLRTRPTEPTEPTMHLKLPMPSAAEAAEAEAADAAHTADADADAARGGGGAAERVTNELSECGLYQVDVMKEASKLQGFDWGAAAPLARAPFAYPRSGGMYPTIFRFVPLEVDDHAREQMVPPAAASASELRVSGRGNTLAGSGWFPLREGLSVAEALSAFVRLASKRWAHVELYNCRSFVKELAELLVADTTCVDKALDNVFRFVVLEREAHGDRLRG